MNEQEDQLCIKRIVIGLDTSHHSLAALRAAAQLARGLGAELHGLFVEDADLLRVAQLSVTKELQFPFSDHAQPSLGRMQRQLRAQARQAREALASICAQESIEWSFQVVRGDVSESVLKEAAKADLLCVGRVSRPVIHRPTIGSTAEAAAIDAPQSVLLISRDRRIRPPIAVLYDGSPETERALLLASELAQAMQGLLSVLAPAGEPSAPPPDIQKKVSEVLDAEDLIVRYRELSGSGVMSVIETVRTEGAGLLVLTRAFLPSDGIQKLLREVDCPVLLTS